MWYWDLQVGAGGGVGGGVRQLSSSSCTLVADPIHTAAQLLACFICT
jgi:hypothetical protein